MRGFSPNSFGLNNNPAIFKHFNDPEIFSLYLLRKDMSSSKDELFVLFFLAVVFINSRSKEEIKDTDYQQVFQKKYSIFSVSLPDELTYPDTTATWEMSFDKILSGNDSLDTFMQEQRSFIGHICCLARTTLVEKFKKKNISRTPSL